MKLTTALIGELREILREEYGADVGEEEAGEIGSHLVLFFDFLARIDHRGSQEPMRRERAPP